MYDTILVPYDGSEEGLEGATHGVELAAATGAKVLGLYVMDLPGAPRALALRDDEEQIREEYREYGEEVLADLGEVAADHGVEYATTLRTGSVSEEIIDCADETDGVDLIVMGTAYRGRLGSLLGGTATKVVNHAPVPVLTRRMRFDEV